MGFMARSAFAATGAVACTVEMTPRGTGRASSDSTAGTSRLPSTVCIPNVSAPENCCFALASTSRTRAGVKMMNVGTRSMSSSTISELNVASPTNFALNRIVGATRGVPIPGSSSCACE